MRYSYPQEPAFPSWPDGYEPAPGMNVRVWLMAHAPVPGYTTIKRELDESARLQGDPAPYISDTRIITEQAKYARRGIREWECRMTHDVGRTALPDGFIVPDRLAAAFEGRTALNLTEAAASLEMDPRRFRDAVDKGRVRYILRGGSEKRRLRRFLLIDLIDYLKSERKQACPSTAAKARRTTGRSSGSTVYDFASLRERLIGG